MNSTHWRLRPDSTAQDATLHISQDGIAVAIQPYDVTTWPDGGVHTSVEDPSRFFIALLNGGSDPGLKTEMLATPDLRTGIVFFTNTSGAETGKAYVVILKALFEHAEALRQGHHE